MLFALFETHQDSCANFFSACCARVAGFCQPNSCFLRFWNLLLVDGSRNCTHTSWDMPACKNVIVECCTRMNGF